MKIVAECCVPGHALREAVLRGDTNVVPGSAEMSEKRLVGFRTSLILVQAIGKV